MMLRRAHVVRRLAGASVATIALAACASSRAVEPAAPPQRLELVARVEHLDRLAREPMMVQHPDGTLFVAGYAGTIDTLWRSADDGASWSQVDLGPGAAADLGNSDVDLAIAADGTLYFASMTFDRTTKEGVAIAVGVSSDRGSTWTWQTVTRQRFDDRPWIEVTPDGAAHLIWNDGSGVAYAISRDRGASWSVQPRVHDRGGSSHLATGPHGEIAVRVSPASASGNRLDAGVDLVAVSVDGGASWVKHELPGNRDWRDESPIPRWVDPLAWDAAGALYAAWTETDGVWLARSRDRGASWTRWRIESSTSPTCFFPYLIARGNDDVVLSWFSSSKDDADLSWHVARAMLDPGAGEPRVARFPAQRVEGGAVREGKLVPDAGGEYVALAALRDGDIAVVSPLQNAPASRLGFTFWRLRLAPLSDPSAVAP